LWPTPAQPASAAVNIGKQAVRVPVVEVTARIARLELAETFVISRESTDVAEVVQVEIRHGPASGFGEGAPIDRYEETAESALAYVEEYADALGDDPFALDEIENRLPPRG